MFPLACLSTLQLSKNDYSFYLVPIVVKFFFKKMFLLTPLVLILKWNFMLDKTPMRRHFCCDPGCRYVPENDISEREHLDLGVTGVTFVPWKKLQHDFQFYTDGRPSCHDTQKMHPELPVINGLKVLEWINFLLKMWQAAQIFPTAFGFVGLLLIVLVNLPAYAALQLKIKNDNNSNHNQSQEVRRPGSKL